MTALTTQELPATPPDVALLHRERAESAGRSTGELLAGIASDASDMLRLEIEAAKIDIRQEVAKARTAAISAGLGAGCAAIASLLLALAVVWVIDYYTVIPMWLSSLIVGVVLAGIGGALLMAAKKRLEGVESPRAIADSKRDISWIKEKSSV